jgi:predicted AlkP superfamily phosphohydrolase/phosphomutase
MDHGRAVLLGEMARGGRCVFYVFTQTDRAAHCFWWRRGMNVNQWLLDEGYLAATDAPEKTLQAFFANRLSVEVDWTKTRAYALGLGQIYLNLRGRESQGVVAPEESDALLGEIERKLLAFRDLDGATPIAKVHRLKKIYSGPHLDRCGDLQLAFGDGYRISWQTALLGGMHRGGAVVEPNVFAWSGDHCSTDRDLVPGVLLSNHPLPKASAARPYQLRDVAATALRHFGIDASDLEAAPLPIEGEPPAK